jgi:hypothetical protein
LLWWRWWWCCCCSGYWFFPYLWSFAPILNNMCPITLLFSTRI